MQLELVFWHEVNTLPIYKQKINGAILLEFV